MADSPPEVPDVPATWHWLIHGFRWYVPRLLKKQFTAVRLTKASAPWPTDGRPVVVALNHPGWWDPLVATLLSFQFPTNEQYAAIDAEAVKRYKVLTRVGFFPVDVTSLRGAADFLRRAERILVKDHRVLWVTVQGRFADVRERPLAIRAGVGHLAARLNRGCVLPVALEYPFWDQPKPEALVHVGAPIDVAGFAGQSGKAWAARIEAELTAALDALHRDALSRDPGRFTTLLDRRTRPPIEIWHRLFRDLLGRPAYPRPPAPEAP